MLKKADFLEINNLFFSNSNNIEEISADLFALYALKNYIKDEKESKSYDKAKKSMFEALVYVSCIKNFKNTFTLYGSNNEDVFFKKICDAHFKTNTDQHRISLMVIAIDLLFGGINFNIVDTYFDIYNKPSNYYYKSGINIDKYVNSWIEGNDNPINNLKREIVYKRLINYVDSLRSLYYEAF